MPKRTKGTYRYQDDNGTIYAMKVANDAATETGFGWVAADGSEAELPSTLQPRYVQLSSPDGLRKFSRVVATLGATAWTTPKTLNVNIDQWDEAGDVACVITSKHGEKHLYGVRPLYVAPGP